MYVSLETEGPISIVTLDDPPRKNAMSEAMADDFEKTVRRIPQGVRAIVLRGSGGAFSGGGDLAMLERLTQQSAAAAETFMRGYYARFLCIRGLGVPLIADVEGPAIGAGLCLALACDMMIVSPASKLALNFVRLGLHPGMGATYFAPRRFGHARASELLLSGRMFTGQDAIDWGAALGDEGAKALAQQIAESAPGATRALVRNLRGDESALDTALDCEANAQARSYASAELREGLRAAREKRAPSFSGILPG